MSITVKYVPLGRKMNRRLTAIGKGGVAPIRACQISALAMSSSGKHWTTALTVLPTCSLITTMKSLNAWQNWPSPYKGKWNRRYLMSSTWFPLPVFFLHSGWLVTQMIYMKGASCSFCSFLWKACCSCPNSPIYLRPKLHDVKRKVLSHPTVRLWVIISKIVLNMM